ncbi:MAG: 1-acyl-sn-glycerol-3-phosphate acyltransferase, partial [Oscillospiraceae bacterium]|nr:1-acyl-sn-glycerol-3-phosphate acyltransferase [Oscillospiraceae bacterium]
MIRFWNAFVKITGWPVQLLCFRTRIYYSDRERQGRRIKGPAILISNHTSVFDYAVWLFVFFSRTLRYQMAELLFHKKPLGTLLRLLGGIYVDRDARDMGFIAESERILEKGGVVGIFPESRLPRKGEERPLPFAPSAAYLALTTG